MMREFRNNARTCSGSRPGRDVEVLGAPAEKQVAHAAADQVGFEAVAQKPAHHFEGVGIDPPLIESHRDALGRDRTS